MKKYLYQSENIGGNLHETANWISKHRPEWDIVTMNWIGAGTVVVYRTEIDADAASSVPALRSAIKAAYARCQSSPASNSRLVPVGGAEEGLREALIDIAETLQPFIK